MEKIVYKITESDKITLENNCYYPVARDERIGYYFLAEILDTPANAELKSKLSVTDSFPLRDLSDDVDNIIALLPTDLCFMLRSLFSRVYLVCDNQDVSIKINETVESGVRINVNLSFIPVEIKDIDDNSNNIINFNGVDYVGDSAVFNAIIAYWNENNPNKTINFNPIFKNRLVLNEFLNNYKWN